MHPSTQADDVRRALPSRSSARAAACDGRCVSKARTSAATVRTCVSPAPTVSLGGVEAHVSLDCKCMAVRHLVVRMVAPGGFSGPCAPCTVGCVRLGVFGFGSAMDAPSDRAPTPRQSRDGVCPSPRDELQCAIERRNSSKFVLRFIKLSHMNTRCAWTALDRLPSALESAVKSSLVEGHVPQKSIVYPPSFQTGTS